MKESQKKKAISTKFVGIKTKDPRSVLTYNLVEGKYNTIDLTWWELISFITMLEDNVELLDQVANEMLRRQIDKDLTSKKAQ